MNDTEKTSESVEQMREGAKQFAAGTKTFVETQLVPAAKKATQDAKTSFEARRASAGGLLPLLTSYSRVALLASTTLFFLGLFLPMHKHRSYINGPTGDVGFVIAMLVIVAVLAVVVMKSNHKVLRIITGVAAIMVGICGLWGGFGNIPNLGISLGALAIGFGGLGQIVTALLILINKKAAVTR